MKEGNLHAEHFVGMNILLVIVIAAIIIFIFLLVIKYSHENRKFPVQTEEASVHQIKHSAIGNGRSGQMSRNMDLGMAHERTLVVFRLRSGDLLELPVSEKEMKNMSVKKNGMLTYQGSKFIAFR